MDIFDLTMAKPIFNPQSAKLLLSSIWRSLLMDLHRRSQFLILNQRSFFYLQFGEAYSWIFIGEAHNNNLNLHSAKLLVSYFGEAFFFPRPEGLANICLTCKPARAPKQDHFFKPRDWRHSCMRF